MGKTLASFFVFAKFVKAFPHHQFVLCSILEQHTEVIIYYCACNLLYIRTLNCVYSVKVVLLFLLNFNVITTLFQKSLTRGNNLLTKSAISHYAQWKRTYQPAISWEGVGNKYTYNSVSYAPHTGILGGGMYVRVKTQLILVKLVWTYMLILCSPSRLEFLAMCYC